MKQTLLTMFSLLLVVLVVFTACNSTFAEKHPPKVVFVNGYADGVVQKTLFGKAIKDKELPIICIDSQASMDEFNQKARENCYMMVGTDGNPVELPTIAGYNDVVTPYTEEFFKEKSLLISYIYVNANPVEFEVSDISIQDGKVTVSIDAFNFGVNSASTEYFIFIEMPKSDLKGVTEFAAAYDVME